MTASYHFRTGSLFLFKLCGYLLSYFLTRPVGLWNTFLPFLQDAFCDQTGEWLHIVFFSGYSECMVIRFLTLWADRDGEVAGRNQNLVHEQ